MWMTRATALLLLLSACSGARIDDPNGNAGGNPSTSGTILTSVIPAGGTTNVDPKAPIVVTFSHPMLLGMEALVVLREGSINGPQIAGASVWSTDRLRLTFTPTAPLKPATTYVLHLAPNLKDSAGNPINWSGCPAALGGQAVPAGNPPGWMNGGMMGGWQAGTGTWWMGMTFTFKTA